MPKALDIQQFLESSFGKFNIIDVRSPKEFEQGHIPGAFNIPLFNDEERAIVGTMYKQTGRQPAILKGMEIVGPNMSTIVKQAIDLAKDNTVYVHCWRGGMRSGFVATLLEMYGLNVFLLKGGYKKFRNFVLQSFEEKYPINLLSGKTGSGKTYIIKELKKSGQNVIDLEGIAHHKGSAFGALGEKPQPSQEQFENELSVQLVQINKTLVWLEDESRLIGKKVIPAEIWEQMRIAKVYYIDLPFEERLKHIVAEYGKFAKEDLKTSILKITKRLGNEQTKTALSALEENDLKTALGICLHYYDKTYSHGLSLREHSTVEELAFEKIDIKNISNQLIEKVTQTHGTN